MISYFKYTNGEHFTLNGSRYIGMFNVPEGSKAAYTQTVKGGSSLELEPLNRYETDMFLDRLDNNRTLNVDINIEDAGLIANMPLNYNSLYKSLDILDNNNKILHAANIQGSLNLVNLSNLDIRYYAISSSTLDIDIPDDEASIKTQSMHIDPFAGDNELAFLDSAVSSNIQMGPTGAFIYACTFINGSGELETREIKGHAYNNDELLTLVGPGDGVTEASNIIYNAPNNAVYVVKDGKVVAYDYDIYIHNGGRVKVDEFDIITSEGVISKGDEYICAGRNYYCILTEDEGYGTVEDDTLREFATIEIRALTDNELYDTIDLYKEGVFNLIDYDMRVADDMILLIDGKNPDRERSRLIIIDLPYHKVYGAGVTVNVDNFFKGSVSTDPENPEPNTGYPKFHDVTLNFSDIDSNLFFVFEEATKASQTRYINVPADIIWYESAQGNLGGNTEVPLNKLLYLNPVNYEDTTTEIFGGTQLKFNTFGMKSNYIEKGAEKSLLIGPKWVSGAITPVLFIHYVGRLYVITPGDGFSEKAIDKLNNPDYKDKQYTNSKNITQYLLNARDRNNTYIGLTLNIIFLYILEDTISLYNEYADILIYDINEDPIASDTRDNLRPIINYHVDRVDADIEYIGNAIHDNEGINYHVIKRVFDNILNLQKSLADSLNSHIKE